MSIGHHVRVILMCILTCCWRINNCAKTARFARWSRRGSITRHALLAWCTKQPCARFEVENLVLNGAKLLTVARKFLALMIENCWKISLLGHEKLTSGKKIMG